MNLNSYWIQNGDFMIKEFVMKDFLSSVRFVLHIGQIAESLDHHPDILIHSSNKVKISLSTPEINQVTEKDHILARKIDEAYT